ncbi:hypothetical protein NMG60_11025682 [Bertholletia excelsa]
MGLMRRIPPKHSETALPALLSLMLEHSSDLLSQVDLPLQRQIQGTRRPYLRHCHHCKLSTATRLACFLRFWRS